MNVKVHKVIIQFCDGYLLTMDEDGNIAEHRTAKAAFRHARSRNTADVRSGADIAATVIEWRDVPAGFTPPEV